MNVSLKFSGFVAFLLVVSVLPMSASGYQLRRTAFSGGGVAAIGGSYSLQATVGEAGPVSGVIASGSFILTEGFWSDLGSQTPVAVPPPIDVPVVNALEQNTPNPFDGSTWIRFSVAETERVRLTVYDVGGRRLAVLADGEYQPGHYGAWWRGGNAERMRAPVAFYRLEVGTWTQTRKMLRIR